MFLHSMSDHSSWGFITVHLYLKSYVNVYKPVQREKSQFVLCAQKIVLIWETLVLLIQSADKSRPCSLKHVTDFIDWVYLTRQTSPVSWSYFRTSVAFLSHRAISFRALPPCIQNNEWYDKGPGTNHKVDKQCYLASHTGAVFSICTWWCEERKHHLWKKPSARSFVCLLLHSEIADDSFWVTANTVTLHHSVSPTMCHPVNVMGPLIFQVCF